MSLEYCLENLRNSLFVPHGAPTFALDSGAAGKAMSDLTRLFKTPRAIIVVSPHWDTDVPTVSTALQLETIYDFYGFPDELYRIKYPATGYPEGAQEVVKALQRRFSQVATDSTRGLDHGAWTPLRQMFPEANIPIIAVSIQSHAGTAHALAMGEALEELTHQGYLVIGSGNITHNLGDYRMAAMQGGQAPDYVQAFADWVEAQMLGKHVQHLIDYRQHSNEGVRSHPFEDHLLPLFVALGAAGKDATAKAFYRGISSYVIAMDGYTFS
jgi:4,5-DOPA dioxygenase extradiol